jgi:hypothetical protein
MPVVCGLDRRNGHVLQLTHDRHLDRSMALLRDGDGTQHLIVDPGYRTGPLTAPLPVSRSIDLLRRACDRLEVELHVPESISVPYATCAVQLPGSSVLMTGGDVGVLECVREFIPPERVLTTRTPWVAYPVFASAGLHCLVTELPEPLLR